jgi:hypothetical protein
VFNFPCFIFGFVRVRAGARGYVRMRFRI